MLPEKPRKLKIVSSENKGKQAKGKNVMKKENKKTKTKQKKMWKKKKTKNPHGDSNLHYDYLLCKSTAPSRPIGYAGTEWLHVTWSKYYSSSTFLCHTHCMFEACGAEFKDTFEEN